MRVFLAAIYTNALGLAGSALVRFNEHEIEVRRGVKNILDSYHYVHRQAAVDSMRRDKARIFLDSGAFSAFTLGKEVDIRAYGDYVKRNADIIEVASVLDGIGDPLKTWQNQQELEQMGAPVLPCFHYGEDERYLEHYIERYPYITLGGMVPVAKPTLVHWLDRIWSKYLTDAQGMPRLKVHGFGLTTQWLMDRYPWYSVDSSSWVQTARTGAIFIPGIGAIAVTPESPKAKDKGQHMDTLNGPQREKIYHEIEKRGFDVERIRTVYSSRYAFNLKTYAELRSDDDPVRPFKNPSYTLFDE